MSRTIEIIGAPTSAGEYAPGMEKAPAALRAAGLADAMERRGLTVSDSRDDPPAWRYRADPSEPLAMNIGVVVEFVEETRRRVGRALAQGRVPLVIGGGCANEVGVVAAHLDAGHRVGLIYLDLHSDMNVPSSTTEGALSWMGVAHMLALEGAREELAGIGPRHPLLRPEEIALMGFDPDPATPFERDRVAQLGLRAVGWRAIAADPAGEARRLLETWGADRDRLLVHFDVDVLDFYDAPLSENTANRGTGLSLRQATEALEVWASDARFSALTVAEINPDHGEEDGSTLRDLAHALASVLGRSKPSL